MAGASCSMHHATSTDSWQQTNMHRSNATHIDAHMPPRGSSGSKRSPARTWCCLTTAISARGSRTTVPASGSSSPISTRTCHRARSQGTLRVLRCARDGRTSVDFPAPFSPSSATRDVESSRTLTPARADACVRVRACVRAWQAGEGVPSNSGVVDSAPSLQYPKLTSVVCGTHSVVQHSTTLRTRVLQARMPSGLERSTAATGICELAPRRCWAAAKRAARARSKARWNSSGGSVGTCV